MLAYDTTSLSSLVKAKYTLELLTSSKTYTGGLSLKLQDPLEHTKYRTTHKFAGSLITVHHKTRSGTYVNISPLNKNWETIRTSKTQKFKIYPSWYTYIPIQTKKGFITATILRFINLSSTTTILLEAVRQFIAELQVLGYTARFIRRTIIDYSRRLRWRKSVHFPSFASVTNLDIIKHRAN